MAILADSIEAPPAIPAETSRAELDRVRFAAQVTTYGAGFEVTDYAAKTPLGPQAPHNRYVVKTDWNSDTRSWDSEYADMTPPEDMFVYLLLRRPELDAVRKYRFPKVVLDVARGDMPDHSFSHPDEQSGRASTNLTKDDLRYLAGPLLKYIL